MSLSLTQNFTAVVPNSSFAQFVAIGGVPPYTYSVVPGGSGGSINSSTGAYAAPPTMQAYPATLLFDTILVTDSTSQTAQAQILVGTPLFLVCDILQNQLGLDNNHIFLWDQKLFQPTDSQLYIAVSLPSCKPFGNSYRPNPSDGSQANQFIAMYGRLDLDLISRGPSARDNKEVVCLALNSTYSQQQQDANGFYIGKLPVNGGFVNLSQIDGAAIPYRYKISYAIQYQTNLTQAVEYFDTFQSVEVVTNQ